GATGLVTLLAVHERDAPVASVYVMISMSRASGQPPESTSTASLLPSGDSARPDTTVPFGIAGTASLVSDSLVPDAVTRSRQNAGWPAQPPPPPMIGRCSSRTNVRPPAAPATPATGTFVVIRARVAPVQVARTTVSDEFATVT